MSTRVNIQQTRLDAQTVRWKIELPAVVMLGAAFSAVVIYVKMNPQSALDLDSIRYVQSIHNDAFHLAMRFVGQPGYPPQVYVFTALMIIILWVFKLKWEAVMEVFATVGIGVAGLAIKLPMNRARPPQEWLNGGTILDGGTNSFTAGHVQSYVAILGFLWYLAYTQLPKGSWSRRLQLLYYGFEILFIGVSRVYLGEHWLTDVIGGYLLGAFWLWLTIRLYEAGKGKYFVKEAAEARAGLGGSASANRAMLKKRKEDK